MVCKVYEYIYRFDDKDFHRLVNFKSPKWYMCVYVTYCDDANDITHRGELFVSSHFSKETLAREFWHNFPQLKKVPYTQIKHFSVD